LRVPQKLRMIPPGNKGLKLIDELRAEIRSGMATG
jgi:hypothetical protein